MFLARKVTFGKWEPKPGIAEGEISADAITSDLRTTGNALSFWICGEGTESEVDRAALALASGMERLDRMDLVWIEGSVLAHANIALQQSAGLTPVQDLVDTHVDAVNLDLVRLGRIARHMLEAITLKNKRRLTRREVAGILKAAIDRGEVKVEALEEEMRDSLMKF